MDHFRNEEEYSDQNYLQENYYHKKKKKQEIKREEEDIKISLNNETRQEINLEIEEEELE